MPLAKTEMLQTNDDGQSFACEKCDYKSTQKGHLKRHKQSMHDKSEIRCKFCRKILSPNGLSRHIKEMHTNSILSCPDCDFITPAVRSLKNHIISNHQTNKVLCRLKEEDGTRCNFSHASELKLKHHIERVHLKLIIHCTECNFETTSKDNLIYHVKKDHKMERYKCLICSHTFSKNASLKIHTAHGHLKQTVKCEECGKVYTDKSGLRLHVDSKHNNIKQLCRLCDNPFSTKQNLRRHIESVHEKCLYICKCGKTYNDQGNLRRHKRGCSIVSNLHQ